MTIEEKAQHYDEAIEKLRDFYRDYDTVSRLIDVKEELANLIPELKESEDERVRNKLIEFFKGYSPDEEWWGNITQEDILAWLEKQDEQKPADKVEPKFKIGDWVIDKQNIVHQITNVIENVTNHTYGYDIVGGGYFNDNTEGVRLWTIEDAKDGDVLSDGTTVFIFKDLLSDGSVMSYCDYDTDSGESDAFCPLSVNLMCSKITPATKEHRDLLFQKMKEAGYEWDAEKKELRKIEQKPAWSEEDEKQARQIERIVHDDGCTQKLQKQIADWFKSLKERYTWRPSDEQMKALNYVVNLMASSERPTENDLYYNILKSLRQQLKKLKG